MNPQVQGDCGTRPIWHPPSLQAGYHLHLKQGRACRGHAGCPRGLLHREQHGTAGGTAQPQVRSVSKCLHPGSSFQVNARPQLAHEAEPQDSSQETFTGRGESSGNPDSLPWVAKSHEPVSHP